METIRLTLCNVDPSLINPLHIRIPSTISAKGGGFINQGSTSGKITK